MTSSLYFLPPTSSPPWLLISSKINSVAPLWGMPQGAAGPERGVATPNLMTSAAPAFPGPTATSTAAATSVRHVRGDHCFIAIPSWGLPYEPDGRAIRGSLRGATIETRTGLVNRRDAGVASRRP